MVIPETTLFEFENWYWITIKTIENCSWETNRKRKKLKKIYVLISFFANIETIKMNILNKMVSIFVKKLVNVMVMATPWVHFKTFSA